MKPVRSREGFTLIELMIVVVVIGILAAIAIPKFQNVSRRAKETEAGPILKQIFTLEYRYQAGNGDFTTVLTDLEGGAEIAAGGKYFDFSVINHATGFCAVATPNAAGTTAGLNPVSLDGNRGMHSNSAAC